MASVGRAAVRILMLSDTEQSGGAGIAASRLAEGFAGQGCEVLRVVRDPDPGEPTGPWRREVLVGPEIDWSQVPNTEAEPVMLEKLQAVLAREKPDLVSLHNIHGGLKMGYSVVMARACAESAPTIWTLHDMWSFTGRCAYPGDCRAWLTGCGPDCPTPDQYPFYPADRIAQAFAEKEKTLAGEGRLAAVTPSAWLAGLARQGLWRNKRVRAISNGLDLERYSPMDRNRARQALGISSDGPVLLAAAQYLDDPRKGMSLLLKALDSAALPGGVAITLMLMGQGKGMDETLAELPGVRVKMLGYLRGADQKRLAYCAADGLVHPALEDNLPNTVVEALACGTPCLGLPVGGMPELVEDGATGWLAGEPTAQGLAQALERFLGVWAEPDAMAAMGKACRQRALDRHDQNKQALAYLDLFSELT